MKKRFVNSLFCICLLCLSVHLKQPNEIISELTLDNIEALTDHITEGDGVVIECGSRETKGKCWIESNRLKFNGPYSYYECDFNGSVNYYCVEPV